MPFVPDTISKPRVASGFIPDKPSYEASGFIPDKPTTPTQLRDIANIGRAGLTLEDAGLSEDKLKEKYWWARAYTSTMEQPALGLAQFPLEAIKGAFALSEKTRPKYKIEEPMKRWAQTHILDPIQQAIDYLDPYKPGMIGGYRKVTPTVMEARDARRVANYQQSFRKGMFNDITESVADFGGLMAQLGVLKKVPRVGKFLAVPKGTEALLKSGKATQMAKYGAQTVQGLKHAAFIGAHGFFTDSGDLSERAKSGLYRIAYNITPVITGWTNVASLKGVAGLITPRVVDTMLNTLIGLPTYNKALKEHGMSKEFAAAVVPQFFMDVLMALSTGGFPEQQRIRRYKTAWVERKAKGTTNLPLNEFVTLQKSLHQTLIDASDAIYNTGKLKEVGAIIPGVKEVIQKPTETQARIRKSLVKNLQVRMGNSTVKVDFDKLPLEVRKQIEKAVEDRPNEKPRDIIATLLTENPNRMDWVGGDAREMKTGEFTFRGQRNSYAQIASMLFKEKLTLDDLDIHSTSQVPHNQADSIKETLKRVINFLDLKVENEKAKIPEVTPLDDIAFEANKVVQKLEQDTAKGGDAGSKIILGATGAEFPRILEEVRSGVANQPIVQPKPIPQGKQGITEGKVTEIEALKKGAKVQPSPTEGKAEIPDNVITKVREDGFRAGTIGEKKQIAENLFNYLEEGDIVERTHTIQEKDASGNYVEKTITDTGEVVIESGRKVIKGKIAGGFENSRKGLELDTGQPFNLLEGDRVIKGKQVKAQGKGEVAPTEGKERLKPRAKPNTSWNDTAFKQAERDAAKDINIPIEEKPLALPHYGAGISASRDRIYIDPVKVNRLYEQYKDPRGGNIFVKASPLPKGLTKPEFLRFVLEHERTHLVTGLDGGRGDEDMVNVITLRKIGRGDLADQLHPRGDAPRSKFFMKPTKAELGESTPDKLKYKGPYDDRRIMYVPTNNTDVSMSRSLEELHPPAKKNDVIKDNIIVEKKLRGAGIEPTRIEEEVSPKKEASPLELENVTREFLVRRGYPTIDLPSTIAKLPGDLKIDLANELRQAGAKDYENTIPGHTITRDELFQDTELMYSVFEIPNDIRLRKDAYDKTLLMSLVDKTDMSPGTKKWLKAQTLDIIKDFIKDDPSLDSYFRKEIRVDDAFTSTESGISDALTGIPDTIGKTGDYAVGEKGEQAIKVHRGLSMAIKAMRFFGVADKDLLEFVGYKNYDRYLESIKFKQLASRPNEVYQETYAKIYDADKVMHYCAMLASAQSHTIIKALWDDINKNPVLDTLSRGEKQLYMDERLALMARASEEVGVNNGAKLGEYFVTDVGSGGRFQSSSERDAFMLDAARFARIDPSHLKDRQRLAFWNIATKQEQNIILATKQHVYNVLRDEMARMGIMDDTDLAHNIMQGYEHRLWRSKQEPGKVVGVKEGQHTEFSKKKYRTYSEFALRAKETGLIPVEDFALNASDYVLGSLRRLKIQGVYDMLKEIPLDKGLKAVIYPKSEEEKANATKLGYRKIQSVQGLAEWSGDRYEAPWVYSRIADMIEDFHSDKSIKGLQGFLKLNNFVKRSVMWTPSMYYLQISSTPWVWMGMKKAITKGLGPALLGEVYWKGFSKPGTFRNQDPFAHLKQPGFRPEIVDLMLRTGIKAFDVDWIMKGLFDAVKNEKHPIRQSEMENLLSWLKGRGGLDRYTFNRAVARNVYYFTEALYDRFSNKKGWLEPEVERRLSTFIGDATGLLNSRMFGKEKDFLMALFFARDFTTSFLRQATGALGIHKPFQPSTKGTEGFGKYFNALFHSEITMKDLKALQPFYIEQLTRVVVSRMFVMAAIQMVLTGTWPWDNEPKKKMMIRTPWTTPTGAPVYINPLIFREATNLVDMLPRIGPVRNWSRGPGNLFRSKLSYIFQQAIDQTSNLDWSGREITSRSEAVPFGERLRDKAAHAAWGMVPTAFRPDIKSPKGLALAQLYGASLQSGRKIQPGMTWQIDQNMQDMIAREKYNDLKLQKLMRRVSYNDPKALDLLRRNGISPVQYKNWYIKNAFPQSYMMKQNKGDIIKQTYESRNKAR